MSRLDIKQSPCCGVLHRSRGFSFIRLNAAILIIAPFFFMQTVAM